MRSGGSDLPLVACASALTLLLLGSCGVHSLLGGVFLILHGAQNLLHVLLAHTAFLLLLLLLLLVLLILIFVLVLICLLYTSCAREGDRG